MLVSDLRHYLDIPPDAATSLRRLGAQQFAMVRAASVRPVGMAARSSVGCIRRPGHRACDGFMVVSRRANGEIAWSCDACGDEGLIGGWESTPADLSALDDSYADGAVVTLRVSRAASELLASVLVMDDASDVLLARSEGGTDGVVLAGRVGAFEELVEYVAAEANAERDRRRRTHLDEVCVALETVLVSP